MECLVAVVALDLLSLPLMVWNLCPKHELVLGWIGAECSQAAMSRVGLLQ